MESNSSSETTQPATYTRATLAMLTRAGGGEKGLIDLMDLAARRELFALAQVTAIAAAAGYGVYAPSQPGLNLGLAAFGRGGLSAPRLEALVRALPRDDSVTGSLFCNLSEAEYVLLGARRATPPRILIAVEIPTDPSEWVTVVRPRVVLRRSARWLDLSGRSGRNGAVEVAMPANRSLTVNTLRNLMFNAAGAQKPTRQ